MPLMHKEMFAYMGEGVWILVAFILSFLHPIPEDLLTRRFNASFQRAVVGGEKITCQRGSLIASLCNTKCFLVCVKNLGKGLAPSYKFGWLFKKRAPRIS